jgi:hypothetical protein
MGRWRVTQVARLPSSFSFFVPLCEIFWHAMAG